MGYFWEPTDDYVQQQRNEIAECQHCISGLFRTMSQLGVKAADREKNIMVKAYRERIEKAKANIEAFQAGHIPPVV